MAHFFKRLAKAAPIAFNRDFTGQPKSSFTSFRIPLGAIAAFSGGISYYYHFSSANLVHLDEINEETGPKSALNPDKWIEFKLQDRAKVSHNAHLFRFSFDPNVKLGLDVASCLITRAPLGQDAEGKPKYVIRPYTPISDPDSKGYFDLLIKVYPEGKMSQHFASLKPGDVVEVKGPIEKLRYSPNMKKSIGMIAGGTGITPMLQVIEAILKNPDDNTQVSLLYANVSPDDILLKQKLDVLAASYPNLKIFYTVDKPSKNWKGGSGYITKDMALKGLPAPSDDTLILVCGPPGMMNHISGDKAKDRSQAASEAESRNGDHRGSSSIENEAEVEINGERLLEDAQELFGIGKKIFSIPLEEKKKFDFKDKGSYFGFKILGDGVLDAKGTRDRNEFYNASKDDILGISDPIPAPSVLDTHRDVLKSYMQQSHSVVSLILRLLNSRLHLPENKLTSLHRLHAVSGDQVRWVNAPPHPIDDRKTALGEHTDFGSVTILFNRLGGLQVLPPGTEEWSYVRPLRGHCVVNLGDAMVKFTAGVLRSNIHRVVAPPGEQADSTRMSLVYFARPEDDVVLKVLEGSDVIEARRKENGGQEEQEEITAKDWILRRALGRRAGGNYAASHGTEGDRGLK